MHHSCSGIIAHLMWLSLHSSNLSQKCLSEKMCLHHRNSLSPRMKWLRLEIGKMLSTDHPRKLSH